MASLLTNTAIELVRRSEHELDLTIERPKKYPASSFPAWTFPGIFIFETHKHKEGDTQAVCWYHRVILHAIEGRVTCCILL
jgi:hypothetical protein